jgi:hypothetical protein
MDKDEIIKLINTYWRFDNDQDSTSTWHDKQDLISAIEQLTIPVVVSSDYLGVRVDKSKAKNKHQIRDTVFRKGSDLNNN